MLVASVPERPLALPPFLYGSARQKLKTTIRNLFCADLRSEGEARKVAQRLADRLAETSNSSRCEAIVVTDEYGNKVCEVAVPSKQ
jgi:hypothetical protein